MTVSDTITVHVWQGDRRDSYDYLLERDPDIYEVPVAETEFGKVWEVADDERVMLSESIDHHGTYAFDVPNPDRPADLYVHTNDSYHDPEDWDDPIERGLNYWREDAYEPFQTEIWGRIMLWVDRPADGDFDA
ncbi:hypothetical protein [Natrinema pallidum]|uniref:Uncharacterized protein n=1 Tax=Natrinema pallidum DSM 3751 TaxID=1227495 RepID=L9YIA9_9EURY|nr:hypothetical protein C487_17635 [Natrinema pallidum DSM 3751]